MSASSDSWLSQLQSAYERPWLVAERLRSCGRRVVGVLGWSVPRELVVAAGLAPIRLSARRLGANFESWQSNTSAEDHDDRLGGLGRALSPEIAAVLRALLDGSLAWIDALVIGRDSEAHTSLFYVLRELAALGERLPPFAFFDLLRLPHRTSAIYNRAQACTLLDALAHIGGASGGRPRLAEADAQARTLLAALERLDALRARIPPPLSGSEMLIICGAAAVLPADELLAMLPCPEALAADAPASTGTRIFLSGSGVDDVWLYRLVEESGASIVGEDHEWGPATLARSCAGADPLDSIVDRYHLAAGAAARASLAERVSLSAKRARAARADMVLHIAYEHDQAAQWELGELQRLLEDTPLLSAQIPYAERRPEALLQAVAAIRGAMTRA